MYRKRGTGAEEILGEVQGAQVAEARDVLWQCPADGVV